MTTPSIDEENDWPTSTTREDPAEDLYSAARFTVDWNRIYLVNKLVHGAAYRLKHKRVYSGNNKLSDIWNHGADLQDANGQRLWLCMRCHPQKKRPDCLVYNGTDHIARHIARQHNIPCGKYGLKAISARPSNPFAAARRSATTPQIAISGASRYFDELEYKTKYTDWVITQDLSFNQAVHLETRDLLSYPDLEVQRLLPKSTTTLSEWIQKSYEIRYLDIKDFILTACSKVTVSSDIWTSTNGLSLLGVVGHFLSRDSKYETVLLGLPRIQGAHTGENIANILASVIKKYGLSKHINTIVMDNATNNESKGFFNTLAKNGVDVSENQRLRCIGHIINLTVKALLFGKGVSKLERALLGASDEQKFKLMREKGIIGRVHNIVRYILRSDQRRQQLAVLQSECKENDDLYDYWELTLIKDGGIRWNSTYYMLKRFMEVRPAIELFFIRWKPATDGGSFNLILDKLEESDWEDIDEYIKILKRFERSTKRLEGNADNRTKSGKKQDEIRITNRRYGALWQAVDEMQYLYTMLETFQDSLTNKDRCTHLQDGVKMAIQKLAKYFEKMDKESPYYFAALALHPQKKKAWFQDKWKKHSLWIQDAMRFTRQIFDTYVESELPVGEDDEIVLTPQYHRPRSADIDSEDEDYRQHQVINESSLTRPRKRQKCADELERFFETGIVTTDCPDPLAWWLLPRSGEDFPTLQKMALDLFSIPAMSSECERVFSQSKKVVTDERNRLKASTIEALECQKNWLRKGLLENGRRIPATIYYQQ
jgi:hypothetical protein